MPFNIRGANSNAAYGHPDSIAGVPLEVAHALVRRQPELAEVDEGFAAIRSLDLTPEAIP